LFHVKHAILLERFYQPYIKRSKKIDGDNYVPIPPNPELAKAVCYEVLTDDNGKVSIVKAT